MANFGERALRDGEDFATIINGKAVWNCGWPGPIIDQVGPRQVEQRNG